MRPHMQFLLTNDDGVHAPGLEALRTAAAELGEVFILAPDDMQSGCGHQVTTDRHLQVTRLAPERLAVNGTPADCVRLAVHGLAPSPAWVLSGINAGGNLGADVYHSGTVAAVREAVLHGVPGIALSHYHKRGLPIDWARAAAWVLPLLRELLTQPPTPGTFWNINLPHLEPGAPMPEAVACAVDPGPLPLSFRLEGDLFHYNGNYHERRRAPGSDVDVCFGGKIAVSKVTLA